MFSDWKSRIFKTLSFRMALWNATLFALSSVTMLTVIYFLLAANMLQRTDQMLRAEAAEVAALFRSEGVAGVKTDIIAEEAADASASDRINKRLIALGGSVVATTDPEFWKSLNLGGFGAKRISAGQVVIKTQHVDGRKEKVRVAFAELAGGKLLQIAMSLKKNDEFLEDYRQASAVVVTVVFLLATAVGWLTAKRAVSGVVRVARTAAQIGQGDLSRRVSLDGRGDEIDQLAMAFNAMVERLQLLVSELKEVTNNIAHDLRSPITRMRGTAEATLARNEKDQACRELAGNVLEECDRLIGIINTMLEIAETESGVVQIAHMPVDVDEICRNACDLFQPVAEDKDIRLRKASPDVPAVVLGDTARLQRVVANLLDNALKYTPAGGSVALTVSGTPSGVLISVADTGVGISEKDLPHVFERFYRADPSRSTPGNGLGLSLVHALVQAHGGEIRAESAPGKGSTFTVRLPCSSERIIKLPS